MKKLTTSERLTKQSKDITQLKKDVKFLAEMIIKLTKIK